MSAPGTPKASQAAITAVQEALAFHVYEAQDTDCRCGWRGGRAEHKAHVAVAAADAAAPHNAAQALRDAAKDATSETPRDAHEQAFMPGLRLASIWLNARADEIEAGR